MSDFYVYGYSDPESCDPYFYIGKGRGRRAWQHLDPCRQNMGRMLYCKLKEMLDRGIQPEITLIEENLTEEYALRLESEVKELERSLKS